MESKKTDLEQVKDWLDSKRIKYEFGRSDTGSRSWVVTDLPMLYHSNYGYDDHKADVSVQFDFLSGPESKDNIFIFSIVDLIQFKCTDLSLFDDEIVIEDGPDCVHRLSIRN